MGWQVIPHPVPPGMKFFDKSGEVYEGAILTHNGTNTRWFADVWLFPELNLAILTATNQAGDAAALATGKAAAALFQKFK